MKWDRERYIAHSLFEDTGREMLGLEPISAEGWGQMAF